jgi:serine/threonine protein kinase/tetratricopeptide (TPR) repeat protein
MTASVQCPRCRAPNAELNPRCRRCSEPLPLHSSTDAAPLQGAQAEGAEPPPLPPGSDPLLGGTLGDYRLIALLGRGGMGIVYRAEELQSGRSVALKSVLLPEPKLLPRIRREVQALSRLRHPGIVRILSSGVHQGLPWYAMELVEGQTLRSAAAGLRPALRGASASTLPEVGSDHETPKTGSVRSGSWWTHSLEAPAAPRSAPQTQRPDSGQVPAAAAAASSSEARTELRTLLTLVRRLCLALGYLHGEGIVHRDLKPDNILLRGASGQWPVASGGHAACHLPLATCHLPVIVDFGLAGQFAAGLSREALELDAAAAGTVAYMAPEQLGGELVDARADLYALGCMLYELLTGRPPFLGKSPLEVIEQHLRARPAAPSSLVPELPPQLDALVLRLLEKEPRRRFGYAEDVAAALVQLGAEDESGLGQPLPRPQVYLYRPGFSGRDEPMQRLVQRLVRLQEQDESAVVLLGGESGVGKTRLLLELGREAARRRLQVLGGECQDTASRPLEALKKPLQAVADLCRTRGEAETERLLGRRGPVLALYEPELSGLPGQERYPEPVELPADAARLRLFGYLAETLGALAEEVPVVLVLDDLQWADELTLGFLEYAGRTGAQGAEPLLVVGTYRSEEVGGGLRKLLGSEGVEALPLGRLEEPAVVAMVADMLALEPAPVLFSRFLTRQSEGNPFFVAEYLRTAVAEGLLRRDERGVWYVAGPEESPASEADYEALPLPHSLRELMGRRFERLSAAAQHALSAAAVLGREVDEVLLVKMAQLRGAAMMEAVEELLARHVLEEQGLGELRFVHDKLREVAYELLGEVERRELHRRAAEAIETQPGDEAVRPLAALGRHWARAGVPDKARPCYLAAARQAKKRYDHDEAERLYRAYLALVEEPSTETVTARSELAALLHPRCRDRDTKVIGELKRALCEAQEIGERTLEGNVLVDLGVIHSFRGRLEEARALIEQALDLHRAADGRRGEGRALSCLANVCLIQGRSEEARELYEQALPIHRAVGDQKTEGSTLANLATVYSHQGCWEEARVLFEQSLTIDRVLDDRQSQVEVLTNLAVVHRDQGAWKDARAYYEQALDLSRAIGYGRQEGRALGGLAFLDHVQGRLAEADAHLEQALVLVRAAGDHGEEAYFLADAATWRRRCQGDMKHSEALLGQAELLLCQLGDRHGIALCLCERAHLALACGSVNSGPLHEAEQVATSLAVTGEGLLGKAIDRVQRAQEAFEAGQHERLFRGELIEDLPEGLRRSLVEAGHLPRDQALLPDR